MTDCRAKIFVPENLLPSSPIRCKQELHDIGLHTADMYNPLETSGLTRIYWNDPTALALNKQRMLEANIPLMAADLDEEF